jgi:metal-dependent amidase/aminoacylase/carboxypeptidase family protein
MTIPHKHAFVVDEDVVAESVEIRRTCGHDRHTAVLLGAAHQLARLGDFSGSIAFIFQPAEENEARAKTMIDDGLFDRIPIRSIYGMHNFPGVPLGHFCTRAGAMMASQTAPGTEAGDGVRSCSAVSFRSEKS